MWESNLRYLCRICYRFYVLKIINIDRSFVRYCGQGSSLLWTPALRPLCRSNAPAQGEEGNW